MYSYWFGNKLLSHQINSSQIHYFFYQIGGDRRFRLSIREQVFKRRRIDNSSIQNITRIVLAFKINRLTFTYLFLEICVCTSASLNGWQSKYTHATHISEKKLKLATHLGFILQQLSKDRSYFFFFLLFGYCNMVG